MSYFSGRFVLRKMLEKAWLTRRSSISDTRLPLLRNTTGAKVNWIPCPKATEKSRKSRKKVRKMQMSEASSPEERSPDEPELLATRITRGGAIRFARGARRYFKWTSWTGCVTKVADGDRNQCLPPFFQVTSLYYEHFPLRPLPVPTTREVTCFVYSK